MKKLIALLLITQNVVAQTLMGYVIEQNSGKKPVANATIKANGANQVASTSNGQFTLIFQGLEIGENVVLRPEKPGWELVNEKEMKTLIPSKPHESQLKIVLCKAGTLAIAKQAYYEVADPYIIQQYNRKLAALDKLKANYQLEKLKLQEDRNRLQNQLDEWAEEFIRVNLDDANEIEKKAIALFKQGKIDESINLRESLKSGTAINNAVKIKVTQDSVMAFHTRNLVSLAKDYIFKFDFKAAEKTYEELVSADTTNIENIFELARFFQRQNQHDKSVLYYQKALRLAISDSDVALTQHNLGFLYQAKNEYPAALLAYSKALEIRERLARINPVIYEPDVALTQNNLGNLYQAKNEYPAALLAYSKALEIYEQLARITRATYEPYVAMTQHNLGTLYQRKNDYLAALNAYNKALVIYERLARTNPATYEPNVAMTQNNLGTLYQAKNEYPAALNAYNKALEIRERLARTNPATYEPDVAMTQNNLGVLYQAINEYPAALAAYTKGLEIRERLARTNPATYESDVATTQSNLGILYEDKNDYPAALNAYTKALEIRERLARTNPATYEPDVALTQNNLGILYQAKKEYPAALNAYAKTLEIYERLAKDNPTTYEPDVARTQNNLGTLYKEKYDYPAALSVYTSALKIFERLARTNLATYEPKVAKTQYNLGNLYQDKKEYPAALNSYSKALEIFERLARTNPATYEPDVAMIQNNLGILYQAKKEYPAALNAYTKALEIRERLARTNPATYEPDVAMIQNNLGTLYKAKNEYPAALSAYSKALEIYERLAGANPEGFEIDMCKSIVLLGILQKSDYQQTRQLQVNTYLEKTKRILPKYPYIPLAKTLMEYVTDLEEYFKASPLNLEIQSAQQQLATLTSNTEKIKAQGQIIERYRYLVANGYPTLASELGSSLGSLAWYQLFERQFAEAEKSANEALNPKTFKKTEDYDTKIEWANTNLALALLFQGKYSDAEKIYIALKDKPYNKATYRETFLADLEELEKAGIMHPDVFKIRELLKK